MRSFSVRLALQQVDRAFDVGRGERLAVMPFDALVQREGEFGPVLAPAPARWRVPGRSNSGVFCGSSCLNMTRLLNTPIIGRLTASVDSSSIDMLAGLAKCPILSVPPACCANAAGRTHGPTSSPAAAARPRTPSADSVIAPTSRSFFRLNSTRPPVRRTRRTPVGLSAVRSASGAARVRAPHARSRNFRESARSGHGRQARTGPPRTRAAFASSPPPRPHAAPTVPDVSLPVHRMAGFSRLKRRYY